MILVPDVAWPEPPLAEDPYAGDELLPWPPARNRAVALFLSAYADFARGGRGVSDPRLLALAAEAGLTSTPLPLPPPAPPEPEERLPEDSWFVEIAEDYLPDLGLFAAERALGPRADEDPSPRQRAVAAGVLAFCPYVFPRVSPVDRWLHDRRGSPSSERAAVRPVHRAPAMLWDVPVVGPPRALLPMPAVFAPPVPVRGLSVAGQPGAPLAPGTWLARCFPGPGGWYAALALPLPRRPDPSLISARMELELWRARALWPAHAWVDLLRERAEVLYRCCHEWLWLTEEVAP